jgi:hypothetical protein
MSQNNRDKLATLTTMEVRAHNLLEAQAHFQDRSNVIMTLTVTFRETRVHLDIKQLLHLVIMIQTDTRIISAV